MITKNSEPTLKEKSTDLRRNRTVCNFTPKYNEVTNYDRKINEFYKDKVINHKKGNESYLSTKSLSKQEYLKTEPEEKTPKVLSSVEVKLKQLYPDLSYAEIEKIKNKNIKNKLIQKPKVNSKLYII
jgi:hypothetical protein